MSLQDELKKHGFTIAVGLVIAAIIILGIYRGNKTTDGHFFHPASVVEKEWKDSTQSRAEAMTKQPENFLPESARQKARDVTDKALKINKELTGHTIQHEAPFEEFFPEAWQNSTAWKDKGVPSSQAQLEMFINDFQKSCGDKLDGLSSELALRLKQGAFTQLRTELTAPLEPQKLRGAATLADKLEMIRDLQKAHWIVEALGKVIGADKTGYLPLRLEKIDAMPQRVKEGGENGLIFSRSPRGAARSEYLPYGTFQVTFTFLIDQRDIPSFFHAVQMGSPAAAPDGGAEPSDRSGSSSVVLNVLQFKSTQLEEKEIVQYFKDSGLASAFSERGIIPRVPPVTRERAGAPAADETETGPVRSSWVSKILRGELEIKPASEAKDREIREYLGGVRYPSRLEVTFIIPDYKPVPKK